MTVRRLLLSLLSAWLLLAAPRAHAGPCDPPPADEPAEVSLGQQIDGFFGDWLVSPLATVLFWDLLGYDDTLPLGTLPEAPDLATLDADGRAAAMRAELAREGEEVLGYDAAEGYAIACRRPALTADLAPVLGEPELRRIGRVDVLLDMVDGQLYGDVQPGPVKIDDLPLPPATAPEAPGDAPAADPAAAEAAPTPRPDGRRPPRVVRVEIPELAPFPVNLDVANGEVVPGRVALPRSFLPLSAGMAVTVDGQTWEIAALEGRRASLRSIERHRRTEPLPNPNAIALPVVVVWLVLGASFFTLRFGFINVRAFWHAILVTAGRYDEEDDEGEVSHFQALSSALSATVGLGNIAGVALAVAAGGPGAVVWMVVAALLGMSSKFAEVSLGQMYRIIKPDGTVSGGPMHYLDTGLKELGIGGLGKVLAVLFAVMAIGGSFGGGNMFQGNQSFQALADVVPALAPPAEGEVVFTRRAGVDEPLEVPAGTVVYAGPTTYRTTTDALIPAGEQGTGGVPIAATKGGPGGNAASGAIDRVFELDDRVTVTNPGPIQGGRSWALAYGLVLAFLVGLVIIGGIKRIGATAEIIVPAMAVLYVVAGGYILLVNASEIPEAFGTMFSSAFTPEAGFGALLGTLVQGFRRASFSNEAGVGSASIAHSAAATKYPVREGIVALLEPFIDTVIVCTMTGLVVVVTGVWQSGAADGITMTSLGFQKGGISWFPIVLAVAVTLFAFSTMISWSYYGERAATWLLGDGARMPYKVVFLLFAVAGPVFTLGNVLDFSDLMILGMAFPNILGVVLLSGKVAEQLSEYMGKLKRGEFDRG